MVFANLGQAADAVLMEPYWTEVAKTKPRLRKEALIPQNRAVFGQQACFGGLPWVFTNQNGLGFRRRRSVLHQLRA
jgi:hypothetical protein